MVYMYVLPAYIFFSFDLKRSSSVENKWHQCGKLKTQKGRQQIREHSIWRDTVSFGGYITISIAREWLGTDAAATSVAALNFIIHLIVIQFYSKSNETFFLNDDHIWHRMPTQLFHSNCAIIWNISFWKYVAIIYTMKLRLTLKF